MRDTTVGGAQPGRSAPEHGRLDVLGSRMGAIRSGRQWRRTGGNGRWKWAREAGREAKRRRSAVEEDRIREGGGRGYLNRKSVQPSTP